MKKEKENVNTELEKKIKDKDVNTLKLVMLYVQYSAVKDFSRL